MKIMTESTRKTRRILSFVITLVMLVSVISPVLNLISNAVEADAYATIFTASDFQGGEEAFPNYERMLNTLKEAGYPTPSGALYGGDYTDSNPGDPATGTSKIKTSLTTVYPDFDTSNTVFVQGNHDADGEELTPTGFHEFADFVVYSINEDDWKTGQSDSYAATVQALAADIKSHLDVMIDTGDSRPVFVTTHVPLHHTRRNSYMDNLQSKYIVDVLNEAGKTLDIVFLFGHNHSSDYDDYLGGSVNYIAKGETMRVPVPSESSSGATGYTETRLNFTYMNYGYVGYSSNSNSGNSTNALTTSAIELCPDEIVISRYTVDGHYITYKIDRQMPLYTDPTVKAYGDTSATVGGGETIYGQVFAFENYTTSWSTTDSSIVEVVGAGDNAQVIYRGEGTATITLTATDGENTASDSIKITVTGDIVTTETVVDQEAIDATYYVLVDTPTAGKNVMISTSNSATSSARVMTSVYNSKGNSFGSTTKTLNAGNDLSNGKPYFTSYEDAGVWLVSNGNRSNSYAFRSLSTDQYVSAKDKKSISIGTAINNSASWTYSSKKLTNTNYTSSRITLSGNNFTLANNGTGTNIYFYEETPVHVDEVTHEETTVIPAEYNPVTNLKLDGSDLDGRKLKYYEASYGTQLMLDSSFSGFTKNPENITVSWVSSNPEVATVDNGAVTFKGSGSTTVYYTVSDGQNTIEKSFSLYITRAQKPNESFVVTDTVEVGKEYAIVKLADIDEASYAVLGEYSYTSENSRLSLLDVHLEKVNDSKGFISEAENITWTAIAGPDGQIYFCNTDTGKYLTTQDHPNPAEEWNISDFLLLDSPDGDNSAVNYSTSDGYYITVGNYYVYRSQEGDIRGRDSKNADKGQFQLYEKVDSQPGAQIRVNDVNVSGKTRTIYSVSNNSSETLNAYYHSFGEDVTVTWYSDNHSVATVDSSGLVSFTGEEGEAFITLIIEDAEGNRITDTVRYVTTYQPRPVRVFKPTTEIKAGKSYIIVSTDSAGAAYVMSNSNKSSSTVKVEYAVNQVDAFDNMSYIEIEEADTHLIWQTSASSFSGYYYLRSEADGSYIYEDFSNEVINVHKSMTGDASNYSFKLAESDSSRKITTPENTESPYSGISWSESTLSMRSNRGTEEPTAYLYEEVELIPMVQIRHNFVNISDTVVLRENILAYQTEEIMPYHHNFSTENITNVWESSDDSIATIDNNGVITYSGKAGIVKFTLTSTANTPDEDGEFDTATSSVTYNIVHVDSEANSRYVLTHSLIPGEVYAFTGFNTVGEHIVMTDEQGSTDSEKYFNSVSYNFGEDTDGNIYFESKDSSIGWECIDAGDGYYYFKNVATGEYLAIDYRDSDEYRSLTTTLNLDDGYNNDSYRIYYSDDEHRIYSIDSYPSWNFLSYSASSTRYRMSADPKDMYIYQLDDVEYEDEIVTQIRIDSWDGTENITNLLQLRTDVAAGDTERLLVYTEGFSEVTSHIWQSDNTQIATIDDEGLINYNGYDGTVSFVLTVEGLDYNGNPITRTVRTTFDVSTHPYEEPSEDYPEYPHQGAVRVDKTAASTTAGLSFQTSGVTEVELSVTGVPLARAVDVVLVFDHSSSMNYNNRLTNAIEDTREFATQLMNSNEKSRLAIVTFDRYSSIYGSFDEATPNYTTHPSATEDRIITGDGTPAGAFMTSTQGEELIAQIDSLAYNDIEGTNYDFGLSQAYQILKASQNDPNKNDKQYVIFMSDGEPYAYNRLSIEYGLDDASYEAWLRGDASNETIAAMLKDLDTYPVMEYFNSNGGNWFAEAIKTPVGEQVPYMPSVSYYDGYHEGLGVSIYSIGYTSDSSSALTTQVLKNIANDDDHFLYAAEDLQETYDHILESTVYAAHDARVIDELGDAYDLQFATSFELENGMGTIVLDPPPCIEVGAWTLNSDSSRNQYRTLEKITFETDEDGYLTAAYSDQLPNAGNIYSVATNKITGKYVTYDMVTEEFHWTIGNVTRDEIVLKYYAYLAGSAEGERSKGTYNTNESAVLYYKNYRNVDCEQVFPVPTMGWKEAIITYEYYFVNELGQPVSSTGVVVPFDERVRLGNPQTQTFLLNNTGEVDAYYLAASDGLPGGYQLYNENAAYNVWISSGDNESKVEIVDTGKDVVTTYYYEDTFTYNKNGVVPGVVEYINTTVAFAVVLKTSIFPDNIVIDYGLPVKITPLSNDTLVGDKGNITAISATLPEGVVLNTQPYAASQFTDASSTAVLPHGTAVLDGKRITYTPTNMTMSTEDIIYYEYRTTKGEYFYTTITVIPATNIYYEDSFITFTDGDGYAWQDAGTTYSDKFQAEDRPGNFYASGDANYVYGRDPAYNDSASTYSLGSAKYAVVDADSLNKEPTAEFTFCGTGFDLFSVTNGNQGAVKVQVFNSSGKRVKNYTVDNYYGYSFDAENNKFTYDPDSTDGLYQVPVIRARDLGYDTYRVVITPKYSRVFDIRGNGSYEIYVDAVRIYDPAGVDLDINETIGKAYAHDEEYNPKYLELKSHIITSETFYNATKDLGEDFTPGAVFIDGMNSVDDTGLSDKYLESGPNNELYLAKGQAISFHIEISNDVEPSSLQLGMKTVGGGTCNLYIMSTHSTQPVSGVISGSHEMYRKLDNFIEWDEELYAQGIYRTKYPIVIMNKEDAIVSLTTFKWTWATDTPDPISEEPVTLSVTADTPMLAMQALNEYVLSDQSPNEDGDTFDADKVRITWDRESYDVGDVATVKIVTPAEICAISFGSRSVTDCYFNENRDKIWTLKFTMTKQGINTFDVSFDDSYGNHYERESDVIQDVKIKQSSVDITDNPILDSMTLAERIRAIFEKIIEILFGWMVKK